jgi:murein DD-endopeptidase MepM/ murein hydrolase activator NlpD
MGFSAGFKPITRAAAAAACMGILPFEGALAQTHVTAASPAQLSASEASLQGDAIATAENPAPSERQPLRYVAPPVVKITIGAENADVGPARYAVRSPVAGNGLAVSFTSSPRVRSIGGPAVLPTQLPIASASLTSGFGVRYHPVHGGSRFHSGVDLAAPSGSPLTATLSGVVSTAGWTGGYGLLVTITHGGGVETRYAHLSRLNVTAGQTVEQGDVIGFVGSTGNSTGPHVHYEVRSNGAPLDPLSR